MKLLLDTHVALWAIADDPRLARKALRLIEDFENDVFVSVASLWEIAIKHSLGRGPRAMPLSAVDAAEAFESAGYLLLPVEKSHALHVERLPSIHGDPFDRLIAAQALEEPLVLLTHDKTVARYSASFIEV